MEFLFGPLDSLLGALPYGAARPITCGFLALAALAALFLKRSYVLPATGERRWFWDLRLWAVAFMIPYLIIYVLF